MPGGGGAGGGAVQLGGLLRDGGHLAQAGTLVLGRKPKRLVDERGPF